MSVLSDELDLEVLRHAVEHHAAELSTDLAEKLLHSIKAIQHQDPHSVTDLVTEFRDNEQLDRIYTQSLKALRQNYSSQERAKSLVLSAHEPATQKLAQEFQQVFNDVVINIEHALTKRQNLELNEAETRILKALVKYQLTTEDLAHTIGRSQSVTQKIVQTLWAKGYIDYLSAPITFILFPALRNRRYRQTQVPVDAFLTTTSKGYFHLYPILQRPRVEIRA
jgi:predicted DNA-binding ribbon-helix-helix protein